MQMPLQWITLQTLLVALGLPLVLFFVYWRLRKSIRKDVRALMVWSEGSEAEEGRTAQAIVKKGAKGVPAPAVMTTLEQMAGDGGKSLVLQPKAAREKPDGKVGMYVRKGEASK